HVHLAAVYAPKGGERPGGGGVRRRAQRQGSERAGGRTTGSWLLPRTGVLSAGDPQRQSGLAPGTDPPGSPESRRVQRVRARVAQGPGTDAEVHAAGHGQEPGPAAFQPRLDRKSTRLNSSHVSISYAVFCLKKKNKE